jgi:hypothetical protein
MEWIYTRTKVSGQISLELAPLMKKKERLIESAIFQASGSDVYKCFDERSWSC